ncbi:MAG: imelysin family protein [Cytophagales bacterium]|nr:imelysin family protein [Cytophagales bacterium]
MEKIFYILSASLLLFLASCSSDETTDDGTTINYDQSALFKNLSENVIQPRYQTLSTDITSLETAVNTFNTTPNTDNLATLKEAYLKAYKQFQYCVVFDFGPAAGSNNLNRLNIYPVDEDLVENNISTNDYNLGSASQIDAKGFPAIDYLLYKEDATSIVEAFASENRKTYLSAIVTEIKDQVNEVKEEWSSTYSSEFIANTGSSAGSSLGFLVNQFNYTLEDVKNFKIGIPAGSRSSLGSTFPEKVEAYYSGNSLILAKANLQSLKELYLGVSTDGTEGEGLDDYLKAIGSTDLDSDIQTKFTALEEALEGLETKNNGVLSEIIESESSTVIDVFDTFTSIIPLTKSEMPSVLSVSITYQDGDGD